MVDLNKEREEVKKNIRSVLLSAPVGLTLEELRNDYIDFIGSPMPFRQFGYNSEDYFLRDIPDVVVMKWVNGKLVLKAACDETTKHIAKLVSKQRIDKNKWSATTSTSQKARRGRVRSTGRGNWNGPRPPAFSLSVPFFLRNKIKQFLTTFESGVPLNCFERAFSQKMGINIDTERLAFPNLEAMLASIPDVAQIKMHAYGELRVEGVQSRKPLLQVNDKINQTTPCQSEFSRTFNKDFVSSVSQSEQCKLKDNLALLGNTKSQKENGAHPGRTISMPLDNNSSSDLCDINPNLQKKVRQVLLKRPKGLWASRLPFEFKAMWNEDLPLREQGYLSVIEFVSAMSNIRTERPNPKGDWLLFDASLPRAMLDEPKLLMTKKLSASVQGTESCQKLQLDAGRANDSKLNLELRESVKQVLQHFPDGISLSNFAETYKEMTGQILDFEAFGVGDLESLLSSLTDILHVSYNGPTPFIFALLDKGPRRFDFLLDTFKPHSDECDFLEEVPYDPQIPEDAVGPKVCYTPVQLPLTESFVEVRVSNIVSPEEFWIQLRINTQDLESLMDALEDTYTNIGNNYRMPESLMEYGQVCATLFPEDNNWHRGIITGRNEVGMILMYYVDYGSSCYVPKNSIRFLKNRFLKLPTQAIYSRLAYIQPADGKWTPAVQQRMLQLCHSKVLIALITDIEDRKLSVCLSDTSGEQDVHINDLLVHENYAIFVKDNHEDKNNWEKQRFVRQVDATPDISFHLINIHDALYLLSSEVSTLFWEEDILDRMLMQSNFLVHQIAITKDSFPVVFQELLRHGVSSVDESTQKLTLYSLEGLPLILDMFGKISPALTELKEAVLEIIKSFDPCDPYWKDQDEEDIGSGVSETTEVEHDSDLDDILTMEELQLALRSLQIRRKRILKSILEECTPAAISELDEVESNIKQAQTIIQILEDKADGKSTSSENKFDRHLLTRTSLLPKSATLLSKTHPLNEQQTAPKTNIVAPLIVHHTISSAAQGPLTSQTTAAKVETNASQLAALNQQLASVLQHSEKMLQSMIIRGCYPSSLPEAGINMPPSSTSSLPHLSDSTTPSFIQQPNPSLLTDHSLLNYPGHYLSTTLPQQACSAGLTAFSSYARQPELMTAQLGPIGGIQGYPLTSRETSLPLMMIPQPSSVQHLPTVLPQASGINSFLHQQFALRFMQSARFQPVGGMPANMPLSLSSGNLHSQVQANLIPRFSPALSAQVPPCTFAGLESSVGQDLQSSSHPQVSENALSGKLLAGLLPLCQKLKTGSGSLQTTQSS